MDSGLKIEIELSFYLALSEITRLKNLAALTMSSKNQGCFLDEYLLSACFEFLGCLLEPRHR
jgi:hypothetical protein